MSLTFTARKKWFERAAAVWAFTFGWNKIMQQVAEREPQGAHPRKAFDRAMSEDAVLLERALGILHRMGTERTGWRRFLARWYYSDEPLRNDAANLVREAGFGMMMPIETKLVGDPD